MGKKCSISCYPGSGIISSIALLAMVLACFGASSPLRAETRDIQLRFLGTAQGLSHQTANCFCRDEFGFIWIGTQDGLNRFDGRTIDVYKPQSDPRSISSNNIRQLCSDQKGHLFIRSLQCVERYDLSLDRFEVLYDGDVDAMSYADGWLYIAAGRDILRLRSGEASAPEKVFSLKDHATFEHSGTINNLIVTGDTLVMTTPRQGLICVARGQIIRHCPIGASNSMMRDPEGNIWVGTREEGLYLLNPQGELTHYTHHAGDEQSLNHNNVRAIVSAGNGLYYIGTFEGLQLLDLRTGQFIGCAYDLGLEAFNIRSIISMLYDDHGTLWMGTFHRGIQYYNAVNDIYRFYRSSAGSRARLASPIVSAMTEDAAGRVWFATEGSGLYHFDRQQGTFAPFAKGLSSEVIKSLLYEPEHKCLWAATLFHGVNRIDLQTGQVQYVSPAIWEGERVVGQASNIVRMIDDGKGGLLLAAKVGLVRLNRHRMRLEAIDNQTLFGRRMSQVWDIVRDGDWLWVTTSFDLFKVSERLDSLRCYTFAELSGTSAKQHINYILKDHRGSMWFGSTGSGIFCYDPQSDSFRNFGSQAGLASGFITALGEFPSDSTIYIAHNHGISRLNSHRTAFENYDVGNGFPLSGVCDGGLFVSRDADIFACGLQGVVHIRHDRLHHRRIDYNVFVKNILVNNRPVHPGDSTRLIQATPLFQKSLTLAPRYSSVTFEIANNNFTDISATGMEYRLEGFDQHFIKADASPKITYTNLSPGRYRFIVRGMQPDTSGRYPETSFELKVRAPLYLRGWFLLLAALAATGLAFTLVRLYWVRQRLEQSLAAEQREKELTELNNQQKFRFFTNVSHEFRTPLTLITGQLELMLQQQDIRPSVYNKILGVYKNARRMNRLIDEVIDIRKQEQDFLRLKVSHSDLIPFVEEIWLSFQDYASIHKIDFTFSAEATRAEAWFDRRQMEKVFYNLLSNAFKYTREGDRIALTIRHEEAHTLITVTDSGIGIAPENQPHIFERFWQDDKANATTEIKGSGIGLSLTKGLVEMHGGTISVESTPGKGTSFKIRLPDTVRCDDPNIVIISDPAEEQRTRFVQQDEETPPADQIPPDKGVKILIVEDNLEMLGVLQQIFDPIYAVYTAQNGAQGLDAARSIQPDLVLSDIMMPIMSGLEMCTRLKTEVDTSHIPVVLLTARNAEEHTVEGLLTGADDYITKPFNIRILVARCNNIVNQRRRLQSKYRSSADTEEQLLIINPHDRKLLTEATAAVDRHLADPDFDVNLFARELGLSRTLLFAKIKGLTGQTPNDFILSMRLKRALSRITADPGASVAEIAYDLGFSAPSYFIRCFRQNFGVTPNAYRKQHSK